MASLVTVTADEADIRLDRWLRRHVPGLPQSAIQKLCRTGQVRVDGRRVEAATRLASGQAVRVPPIADAPPPAPTREAIDPQVAKDLRGAVIYRDEQVIVLDKPPGLPVQGGPGIAHHLDGLLDALRFEAPDRPRLVHRLDRDTSGCLVLARSAGTAAKLAASFRGRDVEKTYWAVVTRRPVPPEGRIDLALKRIEGMRGERTAPAERGEADAARAITDFRTLDHAGKLAWLELCPLTGRTHQIRVHCVAIGAPILGDLKYAQPDQNGAFAATVAGLSEALHLHARRLVLPHPAGGVLEVEAELPAHMRETFRTLGFAAPAAAATRLA
ncbi:MAG: RluA family pseudouridine synthase [Acetobacteraceae bacterium]